MKALQIRIGRRFILGGGKQADTADAFEVAIDCSLEDDDTPESVIETVMPKLYAMAEKERKRRWKILQEWTIENKKRHKEIMAQVISEPAVIPAIPLPPPKLPGKKQITA